MFSLYNRMQQRRLASDGDATDFELTGHDRFCKLAVSKQTQGGFGQRKRKRPVNCRRTQSAAEFDSRTLRVATCLVPSPRSSPRHSLRASSMENVFEHSPLRGQDAVDRPRMPALVRLLGCVAINDSSGGGSSRESLSSDFMSSPPTLRHGNGRYEYSALEDDANHPERLEMESKAQRSASRDKANFKCQQYLYNSNRYVYVEQLSDIGSRVEKHWFVVRDTSIKTERLLSLMQTRGSGPIAYTQTNRETLQELFVALQHPYIYPVLDVDFVELCGRMHVVTVLPLNNKGSLKDFIYKDEPEIIEKHSRFTFSRKSLNKRERKTTWKDDWSMKYAQKTSGMPLTQLQRIARQILEALIFLKNKGFPTYGHLHSGNVILQNGAARLTGLENTLLGLSSRVHPVIWSRAKSDPSTVDSICFGHVLFEMCAGYELCTPQPTSGHLLDIQEHPQVLQVLDFIFNNPSGQIPSINEIFGCDFFRNIDLREMRAMPLPQTFQPRLTESIVELLTAVRQHQIGGKSRGTRPQSTSAYESVVSSGSPIQSRRSSVSSSSSSSTSAASSSSSCHGASSESSAAAVLVQTSSFTERPDEGPGGSRLPAAATAAEANNSVLATPLSASASSLYATPHASMSLLLLSACSLDTSSMRTPDAEYATPAPLPLENQPPYTVSKEHRGLSLHLRHAAHVPHPPPPPPSTTNNTTSSDAKMTNSSLTRRLASR